MTSPFPPPALITAPISSPFQAVKDVRGSNKVTDQDPEGKYEALDKYARDLTKV